MRPRRPRCRHRRRAFVHLPVCALASAIARVFSSRAPAACAPEPPPSSPSSVMLALSECFARLPGDGAPCSPLLFAAPLRSCPIRSGSRCVSRLGRFHRACLAAWRPPVRTVLVSAAFTVLYCCSGWCLYRALLCALPLLLPLFESRSPCMPWRDREAAMPEQSHLRDPPVMMLFDPLHCAPFG